MSDPMRVAGGGRPAGGRTHPEALFRNRLENHQDATGGYWPHVLELGTRRSDPEFPTHHREWLPGARWVMADAYEGTDVDVIADAHDLQSTFRPVDSPVDLSPFDFVIAVAVWEHLARPWIAAQSVADILRPGGWVYIATHQTFPLHGYPSDYFRFSREALEVIFADAGFDEITTGYAYRCTIEPPAEVTRWNRAPDVEAWLNVELVGRRA